MSDSLPHPDIISEFSNWIQLQSDESIWFRKIFFNLSWNIYLESRKKGFLAFVFDNIDDIRKYMNEPYQMKIEYDMRNTYDKIIMDYISAVDLNTHFVIALIIGDRDEKRAQGKGFLTIKGLQ